MAASTGAEVEPCSKPNQASEGADIIIAATNSAVPVLRWEVDTMEGVLREAGDIIQAIKSGLSSREKTVAGLTGVTRNPEFDRKRDDEVTPFKSVGFSLQDLYACSHLYDRVVRNPQEFFPDAWTIRLPQSQP